MTPAEARRLMFDWTPSAALRIHMEAVAACMGAYADKLEPQQKDRWIVCGLLHDFDYERHPSPQEHPFVGVQHLETLGVDEEIRTAILGHAQYSGVPRTTPMARALFAVDELAGFIVACAKVRPNGIADLEALARDTHKFESRYLDGLIGPYPEARDVYVARSPIHRTDQLSCPLLVLQGLEDEIVPPNQSEAIVDALAAKGIPHAYLAFEGEQHGFRRAESIIRSLEAELWFYGRVFGFEPADPIAPVPGAVGLS